jgi:hypothetical protein
LRLRHIVNVHVTKSDSTKQINHLFQKTRSPETEHCQSSSQRRDEGRDERRIVVVSWFVLGIGVGIDETGVGAVITVVVKELEVL